MEPSTVHTHGCAEHGLYITKYIHDPNPVSIREDYGRQATARAPRRPRRASHAPLDARSHLPSPAKNFQAHDSRTTPASEHVTAHRWRRTNSPPPPTAALGKPQQQPLSQPILCMAPLQHAASEAGSRAVQCDPFVSKLGNLCMVGRRGWF
jgi:hypothetical protein